MKKTKQLGIGLLELMLSLAIIAILLIMATRYYMVTSYSQKLNQVTEEMSQIQAAVYSWKGDKKPAQGQSVYDGISGPVLVSAGLIAAADTDGKEIITPWGNTVGVDPAKTTISSKDGVQVWFPVTTGTNEEKACNALKEKFNNLNGDEDITADCKGGKFIFNFY